MVSSFVLGLRVKDVDIVWGTSPPIFQGLSAWLLARLKGARFLFEVRDLWPAFAVAVGVLRNPLLIRASEGLEGFLYRRADRLMVNSPGFVAHVQARAGREPALIPNGADVSMFDPSADGAAFRRAHGLEGKFVALYAGAHGLSNDLSVLLEAARQLADAPHIAIVLLGDGKEKAALMQKAESMGLTNVHFLPPVAKEGMAAALAAADCGIAILKPLDMYKTTYPNKVFDYLAAGRPVALAIDGVIRAVVEGAGAGLFAQPGDPAALAAALRQLAADPAAARRMGLAGRAHLEQHFDRPTLAGQFEALMQEMLE
jgi:glycosyltransferase involved in cell wall biosynthesis